MQNFDGASVEKIVGSGGNFIVEVDDKIIFSKKDLIGTSEPRFPTGGEITRLINELKA